MTPSTVCMCACFCASENVWGLHSSVCDLVHIHIKRPKHEGAVVVRGFAFVNEMESRERQLHVESWLDRFDPCGLWLKTEI